MLDHQARQVPIIIAGRSSSNGWRAKADPATPGSTAVAAAAAVAFGRGNSATAQESDIALQPSSRPTAAPSPLQSSATTLQRSPSKVRFVDLGKPQVAMLERVHIAIPSIPSSPVVPQRGLASLPQPLPLIPRRAASITYKATTLADQHCNPGRPVDTNLRRSKTHHNHSIRPPLLRHFNSGSANPSPLSTASPTNTRPSRAQAIESVRNESEPKVPTTRNSTIPFATPPPEANAVLGPRTDTAPSNPTIPTSRINPTEPKRNSSLAQPAFPFTSVQPLIPKRSASKGHSVRSHLPASTATSTSTTANMAMATPALGVAPAHHQNGSSSQQYNGILQAQSPPQQPLPRQRTLKTSKSVDGLSRLRAHTADASMQPLTRQLQHLFIDSSRTASPTLTQSQIDAYSQNATSSPTHQQRQPPSSSGSGTSSATVESQYQHQDSHPYYQGNHGQQQSGYSTHDDIYGGTTNFAPSEASGSAAGTGAGTGSIYHGLSVPTVQIASRSTPKLTLFNTPPLSQSTYKDSKETRSFGGQSSDHSGHGGGPRTKPKSHHLKPIPAPQNKEKEDEEQVERDQYGFKKESQWLSHQDFVIFETAYVPIMERRRQKWAIFMNDSHGELPPRSAKLKRYIRKGIPAALRGEAWFVYSGAKDKCDANPGLYNRLVNQAKRQGQANEHADVIERDLHRTFPENINFKSQVTSSAIDGSAQVNTDNVAAIQSLRRVLLAFSLHCPSIGYCQSLNYIAGMLLLFMEEEHAFWTLSVITQNFLPEGMYDVTMEGANIDQAVLMTLVMERLPHIWAKFSNGATHVELEEGAGLPTITLVTSHWFLTLFINILPVESVLRVWDCFFYEGRKILFRVALTILKMHESEITKIDDPLEVFQIVQNIPKRLIDCHKLMETCFKRVGAFDLTTKDIDRRYNHFRTKRRLARAASTSSRGGGVGTNTARRP